MASRAERRRAMFCDLALTCALSLGNAHRANPDGTTLQRLRTTEPLVRTAIEEGQRRSPTFASLVDMIERSGTFVYVTRAFMLPHRMEGCLVPNRSRTGHLSAGRHGHTESGIVGFLVDSRHDGVLDARCVNETQRFTAVTTSCWKISSADLPLKARPQDGGSRRG
jgi:hypothetical protein